MYLSLTLDVVAAPSPSHSVDHSYSATIPIKIHADVSSAAPGNAVKSLEHMAPEYYNHWAGSGVGRGVPQPPLGVSPQATPPSYRPMYSPAGPTPPVVEGTSPTGSDPKKKRRRRADGSPGAEEKRTKTGRACDACVSCC